MLTVLSSWDSKAGGKGITLGLSLTPAGTDNQGLTILKAKQHSKRRRKHPRYNKTDPYYMLTRREQVTVFRLRTGHNRLNYHLYSTLRYWQSDKRTSTAVLPHLRATQKGNLARPHSRSPQAVRKPEGPAMHCHLHWGDWSFHLTNEKMKKKV